MAVADILKPRWNMDLMKPWRGRYRSKSGWMRILKHEGCASVGEGLQLIAQRIDLVEVDRLQDFDLGLIEYRMNNQAFQAPAFFFSGLWHARSDHGVLALLEASKAWRQQ